MLTRTGYLATEGPLQEIKKELTVRPIVNGDYGFPPPPFNKPSNKFHMYYRFLAPVAISFACLAISCSPLPPAAENI